MRLSRAVTSHETKQRILTPRLFKRHRVFFGRFKRNFKVLFVVDFDDTMLAVRVTSFHAKCLSIYSPQNCDVVIHFIFMFDIFVPKASVKDCLHDYKIDGRENLNVCLIGMCL